MGVIERSLGKRPSNLSIQIVPSAQGGDSYTTRVECGRLYITATSPTAACRGFYDWCGSHHLGLRTWSANTLSLPRKLADEPADTVSTPFLHRQYMNVCTLGYTMPYWGWDEWEEELDRMALHGINMTLAPIGSEAIYARVWRKLGLSDEDIDAFVTGPAHLPWFRMGNMSGLDGGGQWYDKSLELQHKIVKRMEELGIEPVFNAFAGFVPEALKRLYPDVEFIPSGWQDGPDYVSTFLSPETPLYQKIAKMYIQEWEAEFGKGKFYLADSFNEMSVPFAPQGTPERFAQIASYGKTLYQSISQANPDAVWVLQGWMFGYQRNIWDPESIRALFSEVPDDKLLVLDLSEDYNHDIWEISPTWEYAPALYGKHWIYSTVPNFGGRNAPVGNLEFYLNGHLNALESANKGNLIGLGSAPEGVENNDVVYEIIYDAPWHIERRDIHERLREYSINRYGSCPAEMEAFWNDMLESSYSFTSSQAIYRLQRQPFFLRGGRYDLSQRHFSAIEHFIDAGKELGGNPVYLQDLALWAGYYAFGKAEILADEIERCFKTGESEKADSLHYRFKDALLRADSFLDKNPLSRLERWRGFARAQGDTPEEKDHYETNARRLITTWGRGRMHDGLDDYAARIWSGLTRDYYLPRWEHWFEARAAGEPFDFDNWEYHFAEDLKPLSPAEDCGDILEAARKLPEDFAGTAQRTSELPGWSSFHLKKGLQRFSYMLYPSQYAALQGLGFKQLDGDDSVSIERIRLRGAKTPILDINCKLRLGETRPEASITLNPDKSKGPVKYIYLDVYVRADEDNADSEAIIELL